MNILNIIFYIEYGNLLVVFNSGSLDWKDTMIYWVYVGYMLGNYKHA